jgi:hypothetical protein
MRSMRRGRSHNSLHVSKLPKRATNRAPNAESVPLPSVVRHRGTADERERGPLGARDPPRAGNPLWNKRRLLASRLRVNVVTFSK